MLDYAVEHQEELGNMPPGAFAVADIDDIIDDDNIVPGVIFCLYSDNAKVRLDSTYALAPYYLVYVSDDGEIKLNFTNAKQILDILKKLSLGRSHASEYHVGRFNRMTADGADMSRYQEFLAQAVAAVTGKAEEKGVESLFQRGGTVISADSFKGIDDFEVISYLIILPGERESD